MPLIAEKARARFTIAGADFAPVGLAEASEDRRRAYWRQVAVLARDEKLRELKQSVDVNGARLLPRKWPRRDRAAGRVLIPHWNDSRFITQLRWEGSASGAVLWWRFPWGRIVGYHAVGVRYRSGRVIVRDVVGLTVEAQERVRTKAAKWWAGQTWAAPAERQFFQMPEPPAGVVYRQYEAYDTGYRKPPPRPAGSIFAPRPGPSLRPVPPVAPVAVPVPPWELERIWANVMDLAWRGALGNDQLETALREIRQTQSLDTVRDTLRRLGVLEPVRDWDRAIELLKLQALSRRGGLPGVWSGPAGPTGGPRRPLRAAVQIGAAVTAGLALGELLRQVIGDSE